MPKKKKIDAVDPSKVRVLQLTPVAQEIIDVISKAGLPIGDNTELDAAQFDGVASKVLAIMLRNEVKYVDIDFLFQLVFQPFSVIKETVSVSIKHSFDRVINKSIGKEFREVTLKDMDTILLTPEPQIV